MRSLPSNDAMLTWDEGTGKTTGFSLGGSKDLVAPVTRETHLDDQMNKFGLWQDWAAGKRGRQR